MSVLTSNRAAASVAFGLNWKLANPVRQELEESDWDRFDQSKFDLELLDNEPLAYAMYKTKTYFQDEKEQSPKFIDAMQSCETMTSAERDKVRKNALRRTAHLGQK